MTLIPPPFLFRVAYPCHWVKDMPIMDGDELLNLPESCRIEAMADGPNFADVRLAWNELGIGIDVAVRGKDQALQGDVARPRDSDGVTLWIDTRDARTSHRGSRHCHQFHLLPVGGGHDKDDPAFVQTKINRALQDAPTCSSGAVMVRHTPVKSGFHLEAFLTAASLTGYDPEQNPRLGFYYVVHDQELGNQVLSVGGEFPYAEDPSLWSVLDLQR
jgi:hypothetical protein